MRTATRSNLGLAMTVALALAGSSSPIAAQASDSPHAAAPLAAGADVPAESDQLEVTKVGSAQNPNNDTVFAFYATPTAADGNYAEDGTILKLDTYSCGNFLGTASKVVSAENGRGGVVNFSDEAIKIVGRSIQYTLTITQPGYDPYERSGSYSGYTVKRPSCDEINDPTPANEAFCRVSRTSVKVASERSGTRPVVGSTVSVSATRSPNCRVTYRWTLNGKKARTGRSLYLSRAMRDKSLLMKVKVWRLGFNGKEQVLRYGRVRSR